MPVKHKNRTYLKANDMAVYCSKEVKDKNIVLLTEPHSDLADCNHIFSEIIRKNPGSHVLCLEAPHELSGNEPEIIKTLKSQDQHHLIELFQYAKSCGWKVECVDADTRSSGALSLPDGTEVGRYSQERQEYIAQNISTVAKSNMGGVLVLYGRRHLTGGKVPCGRGAKFDDFYKTIARKGSYKQRAIYTYMSGKVEITGMSVDRGNLGGTLQ